MIQGILSQKLTSYCRNFFQDFDEEAMEISLWDGQITMNDLTLKSSALDYLMKHMEGDVSREFRDCKLKILHGRVGKLQINVPWKKLRTVLYASTLGTRVHVASPKLLDDGDNIHSFHDSCSVLLSDVHLLITPVVGSNDNDLHEKSSSIYNDDEVRKKKRIEKEKRVLELIQRLLIHKSFDSLFDLTQTQTHTIANISNDNTQQSWFRRFIENILYHTTIRIQNVDIRYEDAGDCFGYLYLNDDYGEQFNKRLSSPFAFGIMLRSLTIQSTNEVAQSNNQLFELPTFENQICLLQNNSSHHSETQIQTRHIVLSVHDFGVYWDDHIMSNGSRTKEQANDKTERYNQAEYEYYFTHSDSLGFFKREYIIEPLDLSISFSLSAIKHSDTDWDSSNMPSKEKLSQPSTRHSIGLTASVPSLRINVNQQILRNASYLHQSMSLFQTLERNESARKIYVGILTKRPYLSPILDPSSWWKYAMAMVVASNNLSSERKWNSWRGIMKYVRLRKQYVSLYRILLTTTNLSVAQKEDISIQLFDVEDQLSLEQIACLRFSLLEMFLQGVVLDPLHNNLQPSIGAGDDAYREALYNLTSRSDILSSEYRDRYFYELSQIVHMQMLSRNNTAQTDIKECSSSRGTESNSNKDYLKADISILFPNTTINVCRDRGISSIQEKLEPLLELSSALVLTAKISSCGSKELGLTLAATKMKFFSFKNSDNHSVADSIELSEVLCQSVHQRVKLSSEFPVKKLIDHVLVRIQNRTFHHTASFFVRMNGDATTNSVKHVFFVRLSPIDFTCSNKPLDILSETSRAARSVGYYDNLRKILSVRKPLNRRALIDVIYGRENFIYDINIHSPVIILDDAFSCGTLLVDCGRICLTNGVNTTDRTKASFTPEESRSLEILAQDCQVICTNHVQDDSNTCSAEVKYFYVQETYLIEPFSITAMTIIPGYSLTHQSRENQIWFQINLSPLSLNLPTSSLRLLHRLRLQAVKEEKSTHKENMDSDPVILNVELSMPSISARFSNDVDDRVATFPTDPVQDLHLKSKDLIQVTMKKIHLLTECSCLSKEKNILVDATVQYINAMDLFQDAGNEFSTLVTTAVGKIVPKQTKSLNMKFSITEEDSIECISSREVHRLSISLPDLWIEWNPETIASLQKAIRLSEPEKMLNVLSSTKVDNGAFQFRHCFYQEYFHEASYYLTGGDDLLLFFDTRNSFDCMGYNEQDVLNHDRTSNVSLSSIDAGQNLTHSMKKSSVIAIDFSKVCIHFNKDARRRRLAIAELSEVRLHHMTKPDGGFNTSVDMIDFVLSDPLYVGGTTLYREIVGLKHHSVGASSTFHLGFESFPRPLGDNKCPYLNEEKLTIDGYDTLLSLRFSPMRFVYLQQLWMEIIDYFFEGIIGYEVFGKERPKSSSVESIEILELIPADMRFLRFNIAIESPLIIIPAMCRSPNFFSVRCDSIYVSNRFDGKMDEACVRSSAIPYLQLYNNCSVLFSSLSLSSWNDRQLTLDSLKSSTRSGMALDVRWPIGARAVKVTPKWDVRLSIEPIRLSLQPIDYSLFLNLIQQNIGEVSRFQNEWVLLMNLSHESRRRYLDQVLVNFSYDKKDAPFTTYSLTISTDSIRVLLLDHQCNMIMDLDCSTLSWNLAKGLDRQVVQSLSIGHISAMRDGTSNKNRDSSELLLRRSAHDPDIPIDAIQLFYSSRTRPNGDNVRCLEIRDSILSLLFPTWIRAKRFFQDLPSIDILMPEDVLNSMQVGDRWYKIERNQTLKALHAPFAATQDSSESRNPGPEYQFRILLTRASLIFTPSIYDTDSSAIFEPCGAIIVKLASFDYLSVSSMTSADASKVFYFNDIEIFVRRGNSYPTGHDQLILKRSHLGFEWSNKVLFNSVESRMAAYTDDLNLHVSHCDLMSITETSIKILGDVQKVTDNEATGKQHPSIQTQATEAKPKRQQIDFFCPRLSITLVDDSLRQFSCSQRLIEMELRGISYCVCHAMDESLQIIWTKALRIMDFEVKDHLQNDQSPFHVVLTTDNKKYDVGQHNIQGNFLGDEQNEDERYAFWTAFAVIQSLNWGYYPCKSMSDRIVTARNEMSDETIAINICFDCQEQGDIFSFQVQTVDIQWNPSLVVATQALLGRTKNKIMSVLKARSTNDTMDGKNVVNVDAPTKSTVCATKKLSVQLFCGNLTVCLNKEHQNRRLLQITVDSTAINLLRNHQGQVTLSGGVDNLVAWDTNDYSQNRNQFSPTNRLLLSVNHVGIAKRRQKFVTFDYVKNVDASFRFDRLGDRSCVIPDWTRQYVNCGNEKIDDCLSVQLASVKLNYIRERTAEIVDYLSNGLPGKGMGATSRAAKGFISKRMNTRSFLDLSIDSPEIFVPVNNSSDRGLVLFLGDLRLKSWFDEADEDTSRLLADTQLRKLIAEDQNHPSRQDFNHETKNILKDDDTKLNDLWRVLSISVSRLGLHTDIPLGDVATVRLAARSSVNVHIVARKPLWIHRCTIIRGSTSSIECKLKYKEYVVICDVIRGNIAAPLDMNGWDNIEKAYEEKLASFDDLYNVSFAHSNESVQYVEHAKVVRYGTLAKARVTESEIKETDFAHREGESVVNLDFRIFGIKLHLHRDDPFESYGSDSCAEEFNYDILLLYVSNFDVAVKMMVSGDQVLSLTFKKLGLFDLGENGRLLRESKSATIPHRKPCAFHVVAEGYTLSSEGADSEFHVNEAEEPPHLQLTLKTTPVPYRSVVSHLFVNHISVNPLDRPIRETIEFFSCAWSKKNKDQVSFIAGDRLKLQAEQAQAVPSMGCFELNIIAHYPTIFLLADETDPLTRALVLRGRAVIKMKNETKPMSVDCHTISDPYTVQNVKTVKAHLQSMESYICPQAACVLEESSPMQDILSCQFLDNASASLILGKWLKNEQTNLGVALMDPVTALLELEQTQMELFPTSRTLSLYIDPVSVSLSFEDLCLIDRIRRRWAFDQRKSEGSQTNRLRTITSKNEFQGVAINCDQSSLNDLYEVEFTTEKLGIILMKQGEKVIVDRIHEGDVNYCDLREGDEVVSINHEIVFGMPFQSILDILTSATRPLRVMFRRQPANHTLPSRVSLDHKRDEDLPNLHSLSDDALSTDNMILYSQGLSRFTAVFKMGQNTGLQLVQSMCGNMAVVEGCNLVEFKKAMNGYARIPRIGAVIVALNCTEATCRKSIENKGDPLSIARSSGSKGIELSISYVEVIESLRRFEECSDENTSTLLSITFLEAPSVYWGSVDDLSIEISRVQVALIDDINGRDMPLLRGKLDSVCLSLQRGLGTETAFIRPRTHFLLKADGHLPVTYAQTLSDDLVMKGRFESVFALDYYNSRISVWEPLLEYSPPVKCFFERQKGSQSRSLPGHVSLVLTQTSSDKLDPYLCMNLTDAAVDILTAAAYELKRWMTEGGDSTATDQDPNITNLASPLTTTQGNHISSSNGYSAQIVAADAALIFARRHETKPESNELTKPFVLRNKTGLTIQFFRTTDNDLDLVPELNQSKLFNQSHLDIKEVPDGEEASFSMNVTETFDLLSTNPNKTVRGSSAEHSPFLNVILISSSSSFRIETLRELPIMKTGSTIRRVVIHRCNSFGEIDELSSYVVWSVEIESNRRVITISSAISVVSAIGFPIEIGLKVTSEVNDSSVIRLLGVSIPDMPYFLPLSLDLCFEPAEILIRPKTTALEQAFEWSSESVLKYNETQCIWKWVIPSGLDKVSCKKALGAAYISVKPLQDQIDQVTQGKESKKRKKRQGVILDSFLTLRNALPVELEWDIADSGKVIPSSFSLGESLMNHGTHSGLSPGGCVDILECDTTVTDILVARFRCSTNPWSSWTSIPITMDEASFPDDFQETIIIRSENDARLDGVIGLKRSVRSRHGIDLIIYCELWISNCSNIPLLFGAQKRQNISSSSVGDSGPSAAESALIEITSILEFGDKGKGIEKERDETVGGSAVYELSHQLTEEIIDEVFEYIEISQSLVKRRWWAGDLYDDIRSSPSKINDTFDVKTWYWDDDWMIDCSGECSFVLGGWESCLTLVGSPSKYFSAKRTFDPTHPFRRRRWYRRRVRYGDVKPITVDGIPILFHQPCTNRLSRKAAKDSERTIIGGREVQPSFEDEFHKLFVKTSDGAWSSPIEIPHISSSADGIIRVLGSRWPQLPVKNHKRDDINPIGYPATVPAGQPNSVFNVGSLSPRCYELSYHISTLEKPWGESTKYLTIFPRFTVKNASETYSFELKQSGSPDSSSIVIGVSEERPFYWTDVNLPELICVRPKSNSDEIEREGVFATTNYKWSGGFDVHQIGLIPLRVREDHRTYFDDVSDKGARPTLKVVRASIEIRAATGGTGVIITLVEEKNNGNGALFRIENFSPFPLWVAQDGVLANPFSDNLLDDYRLIADDLFSSTRDRRKGDSVVNGDVILPSDALSFGLDIPYRQGKYSWRDAATIDELSRVRISLAPLSTRDGIETTKVVKLSSIGEVIRLSPSKLRASLDEDQLTHLLEVKILGLVLADGPTKVLKFCLIRKDVSVRRVLENSIRARVFTSAPSRYTDDLINRLKIAASHAISLLNNDEIPDQEVASSQMLQMISVPQHQLQQQVKNDRVVEHISFEASLSGVLLSVVDSVPSEIAVLSAQNIHFAAKWTSDESTDTTAVVTVGCVQIDNCCPNSPFPVSLHPVDRGKNDEENFDSAIGETPFMTLGAIFAPKKDTCIKVLKCLTLESKDIALAVDLAFICRLQRFLSGLLDHVARHKGQHPSSYNRAESRETWPGPHLSRITTGYIIQSGTAAPSQHIYFQALSVMPYTIKLSVAPANALSYAQSLMEGEEAAAIHAAVRKGDVQLGGDSAGGIGVKIGGKNLTPLDVIHGVFKSILVDGLIRCDGASLTFPGVLLENYMSTPTQLKMYFLAHYVTSMKNNLPALIGSLAAFGNPVGLIRGLGDGVTDFVREPVKGLQKSVKEMDPSYVMDGVAKGTESLARHTFGGIVDSASLLTDTFSKNMAVLTLDRRYAQRRDQFKTNPGSSTSFVGGVESGMEKLIHGVVEGVTGVVRAPIRGAEKKGVEGFAKGVGKGLLGLVVKPVIGLSDAATDVMIGVKGTLESTNKSASKSIAWNPVRPRRAFYTNDRVLRSYNAADATALALMMRTRLAGEPFLSHYDMGEKVALFSVHKLLVIGSDGKEQQMIKFKNIKSVDFRPLSKPDSDSTEWGVLIFLLHAAPDGVDFQVIRCENREMASELSSQINMGLQLHNRGL